MSHAFTVRRFVVAALSFGAIASSAACSTETGEEEDPVGKAESAIIRDPIECPDPSAGTCGSNPTASQKRVTASWSYLLGGTVHPNSLYPCNGPSLDLETLRNKLQGGGCWVSTSGAMNRCGIRVGIHTLDCGGLTAGQFYNITGIAAKMDACWGTGASAFFSVKDGTCVKEGPVYSLKIDSDPEPAKLTAYLSGGTGAVAAAYFVNTGTATTVVKWPASYVGGSVAAGTPCSTVDLAPNNEAVRTIQAVGGLRRCS